MGIEFYGCTSTGNTVYLNYSDPRNVSLCGSNASIILQLIGETSSEFGGSMPVYAMRRALMVARARLPRVGPSLVRSDDVVVGAPRAQEDGTIELRPIRASSQGFDLADMADRLDRLSVLVECLAGIGAAEIAWS